MQDSRYVVYTAFGVALPYIKAVEKYPDDSELYADLRIDSRRFLQIIREIENLLGNMIDDEDLLNAELITIGDLIDFVDQCRGQKK